MRLQVRKLKLSVPVTPWTSCYKLLDLQARDYEVIRVKFIIDEGCTYFFYRNFIILEKTFILSQSTSNLIQIYIKFIYL